MSKYLIELKNTTSQSKLNDFSKKIGFLNQYFEQELSENPAYHKKKIPAKKNKITLFKQCKLDELARKCLL